MKHNETKKITEMRMENGKLPSYAWPGGYPLYYLDKETNALCPECANNNDEFSAKLVAYDINYEDPELFCDHCNKRIESAYAEPEDNSCNQCQAAMINGVFCHETGCPNTNKVKIDGEWVKEEECDEED